MWPFTRKKKEDKAPEVKEAKPSNVRVYPRHNNVDSQAANLSYVDDDVIRSMRPDAWSPSVSSSINDSSPSVSCSSSSYSSDSSSSCGSSSSSD
jgi:hypothetical protein